MMLNDGNTKQSIPCKSSFTSDLTPKNNTSFSNPISSLKRQTDKRFLWLIVDDGSSDGTDRLVDCWIQENNDFHFQSLYHLINTHLMP